MGGVGCRPIVRAGKSTGNGWRVVPAVSRTGTCGGGGTFSPAGVADSGGGTGDGQGRDLKTGGLILATTKGDIDSQVTWMRVGDVAVASPTLGGEATGMARELGIAGPAWTVSAACASGVVGIIDGAMSLLGGEVESM